MLKKNFLSILILIVLVLISAIYFLSNKNNTLSKEASFVCTDLSDITSISIKRGDSAFMLIRTDNLWYYDSRFTVKPSLMSLCYKIFSEVEIKSPVAKKYYGLIGEKLRKSGTEIKLMNDNKIKKHYYLWADEKNRDIYMMMADNQVPYNVTVPSFQGNFAALFKVNPEFWRDLTIIHYIPDQIASVKVEQPAKQDQSFLLEIFSKGKAVLTNLKSHKLLEFNKEAVEEYLFCFKNIKVASYVDNNKEILKSLEYKPPQFNISITDREGIVKSFKIYSEETYYNILMQSKNNVDANSCFVIINNKEIAIAKYVEIDPLTRNIDFFLQK